MEDFIKPSKDLLLDFKNDLELIVQRIMVQKGIKENSNILDSIEFIKSDNGISMLANDYYLYVSEGRKPQARKIPIQDLIDWVKRYKIGSGDVNKTAYAIQQSIYINGIRGKKFIDLVANSVGDYSAEQLSELLSELIAEQFGEAFELK